MTFEEHVQNLTVHICQNKLKRWYEMWVCESAQLLLNLNKVLKKLDCQLCTLIFGITIRLQFPYLPLSHKLLGHTYYLHTKFIFECETLSDCWSAKMSHDPHYSTAFYKDKFQLSFNCQEGRLYFR